MKIFKANNMKRIIKHLPALGLVLGAFTACQPLSSTYDEYVVPGGITYTGKATSPQLYAGRNRVKITWLRGTDPTVTKARVFWNNFTDSVEVPIPASGNTISVTIDPLPEKNYGFVIKTYDEQGNTSVPVELLGASFGEKYQSRLLSRPLDAAIRNNQDQVTLHWGAADISGGAYATAVTYTDPAGNQKVQRVPVAEASTILPAVKPGTPIQYKTIFLPAPLSIDTFYTASQEQQNYLFDKTDWTVTAFSTQHPGAANLATNAIDGKTDTRWHTIASGAPKYPHFITLDMKTEKTITGFELFRMKADDRACDRFQLLVSKDNATWEDLGTFDFNRLSDAGQFYEISSHPQARYLKLVGLSGPQKYMVTGEINVYGL